ncbi:MAG: hypothetical protein ACRESV_08100, partial [Nevskiales bacterium]
MNEITEAMQMKTSKQMVIGWFLWVLAAVVFLPQLAWAGPPLLCWPFDIEGQRSLPFGQSGWRAGDPNYDTSKLVEDTLGLLAADTPVILRMETLRRATVYTLEDKARGEELKARLEARVRLAEAAGKPDALAVFDYAYHLGVFSQTGHPVKSMLTGDANGGYQLVKKAIELRGGDAEME